MREAVFTGGKVCRGWASLNGYLNQRSPDQSPIFFDKKKNDELKIWREAMKLQKLEILH